MKRKIIRYIKILICFVLVFSFIVPNYASLTAADGSTFITKGEFDKALVDFSSRLTTFEAGLNTKIDSQITSFLDRNGIWSGKVQELVENYTYWDYGFKSTGLYNAHYGMNLTQDGSLGIKAYNNIGKVGIYDNKEGDIVLETNKAGLAVVKVECKDSEQVDGSDCRCIVANPESSDTSFACDHFKFLWDVNISFSQEGKLLNSVTYVFVGSFAGTYLKVPKLPDSTLLMFVARKQPIHIKYNNTLQRDNGQNYACTFAWLGGNNGGSKRVWRVKNITIY